MTPAEKASFLAQFPAARAEVAELARHQYPQCFDSTGRPIVATLTWPSDPQCLAQALGNKD